jgi:HlyD family secretion protein
MSRLSLVAFYSVLIACALCSCSKKSVLVVKPKRQIIHQQFIELAQTHLDHPVTVSMPFSGQLGAQLHLLSLRPGDRVKKGQVLVELKQRPLKLALAHSAALLRVDESRYHVAEHQLSRLMKEYTYQQQTLARYQQLEKNSHIAPEQMDRYKLKAHQAYAAWQQGKVTLHVLAAKQQSASAQLQLARHRLDASRIRAPISGEILQVYHHGGSWLNAGVAIMQLGNLDKIDVASHILSDRLHQLKVGDAVGIGFSRAKFPFRGVIERIYPKGYRERSPLGVKEQRVPVIIKPDNLKKLPRAIGYRLYVQYIIRSYQALTLPSSAVMLDKSGDYFVYTVVDAKLVKQSVTIGIESHSRAAILSGLNSSDVVAEFPSTDMSNGEAVVATLH